MASRRLLPFLAAACFFTAAPLNAEPGSLAVDLAVDETGRLEVVRIAQSAERPDLRAGPGSIELTAGGLEGTVPDPRYRHRDAQDGGRVVRLEEGRLRVRVPTGSRRLGVDGPGGEQELELDPSRHSPPTAPSRAVGDTEVRSLWDHGPPDVRQDLVFLAEGYTAAESDTFFADVARVLERLRVTAPYDRYHPWMNAHAVFIESAESGADHPETDPPTSVDTPLECAYGAFGVDRLLDCDVDAVLAYAAEAPGDDVRVVLVNDSVYGGSGGPEYGVSYTGDRLESVAVHELGHTDALLADEYSSGEPWPGGGGDYVNCSRFPDAPDWQGWIDAGEPGVSAFPGCTWADWFRPTEGACLMKDIEQDYCPVCREAVVLALHRHLPSLVEGKSPDGPGWIAASTGSTLSLSVAVPQPVGGALHVVWTLREREELLGEGEGLTTLRLAPERLGTGRWTIDAVVEARTPWVIDDPFGFRTDRATFFVEVGAMEGGRDDDDSTVGSVGCPAGSAAALIVLPACRGRRRRPSA